MHQIVPATTDSEVSAIRKLFEQYAACLPINLDFQHFNEELGSLPGAYTPPHGALLLSKVDGVAVGCIALRPFSGSVGELKRLYVMPAFRGQGLARALVSTAIATARSSGYTELVLDTLSTMPSAIALYQTFGFKRTEAYYSNPVPDALYFRLALSPQ